MTAAHNKPQIMIVEDQTIFREMLSEVLTHSLTCEVASQVSTGAEALEEMARGQIDLVILDAVLPDTNGVDVLLALRKNYPRVPVLMVTAYARPTLVKRCVELGAHAFVTKAAPLSELREAVDRVLHGGRYFCSETSGLLADALETPQLSADLTKRQREILQFVAQGMSSKEIAQRLELSLKTVENHRLQIRQKLDLHDVAGLTRYAIEQGLVEPKV